MEYTDYPGQLFLPERRLLCRLAKEAVALFGPKITIVNIGVRQGGSLHCLRAGAPEATIYGIDINLSQPEYPFVGNPRAKLIEGDSGSIELQSKVAAPVHLLFVDGSHEVGPVRRDIDGWTPKIPVGGVVVFHDYYETVNETGFGVRISVDGWKASPGWAVKWRQIHKCKLTAVFKRIG